MGGLIDQLRLAATVLWRAPRLTSDFIEVANRRFACGSSGVIGWSGGCPSYHLLSPPLLSKPSLYSLATRLMSLYQWRKLPDFLSAAVTDACPCSCEHCSVTSMTRPGGELLSTAEWRRVLRQAQELGVATVAFVGGEPLLREDLCELVGAVDKDLSQAILFTSGAGLPQRARELRRAGLTSAIVCIDSADPAANDRRKGSPGAFARATAGIAAAREQGLLTGISAVVRPQDLEAGAVEELAELGRELAVNQVILFDAVSTGNYAGRSELRWSAAGLEALTRLCGGYEGRSGYPSLYPYAYAKTHRGIGCAGGVLQFYVAPHGDVCPCDFDPTSVGNVREAPLHALWDRFTARGYACTSLAGCRRQVAGPT